MTSAWVIALLETVQARARDKKASREDLIEWRLFFECCGLSSERRGEAWRRSNSSATTGAGDEEVSMRGEESIVRVGCARSTVKERQKKTAQMAAAGPKLKIAPQQAHMNLIVGTNKELSPTRG